MPIEVNPEILTWARQSAGFDVEDAARKLGFSDSSKSTAAEKLVAMEAGEKKPTRNQLAKFANVYKRPLITFYLAEPPKTGQRGQDFRQTPDARGQRDNGMLDALLRDVKARQELVRDILLDEEDFAAPDFVGSANIGLSVAKVVEMISTALAFDHTDISLRKGDASALFGRLRAAAEDAGVFVLVLGDLGHHTLSIGADVFRGFAIADPVAPFVVINAKDARPARAFTLIHELAHVFLGQTGVSGSVSTEQPTTENARIERFCNDVASEFLLPERYFRTAGVKFDANDVEAARVCIDLVASRWSVSEPMVAYRFQRTGELSSRAYQTLRQEYHQRWLANVKKEKAKQKENDRGPSGYVIKYHNLGHAFVDVVSRNFKERNLTHTNAARLLGAKAISIPGFLNFVESVRRKNVQGNGHAS